MVFIFLLVSKLLFSQENKIRTYTKNGINNYKGIKYEYQATFKYQLLNAGYGDIKLKVGVTSFRITDIKGDIGNEYYNLLPINNAAKQFNVFGTLNTSGAYARRMSINFREGMVNKGALDEYYFTNEEKDKFVEIYILKSQPENFKTIYYEIKYGSLSIIPEYIPVLNKIIDDNKSKLKQNGINKNKRKREEKVKVKNKFLQEQAEIVKDELRTAEIIDKNKEKEKEREIAHDEFMRLYATPQQRTEESFKKLEQSLNNLVSIIFSNDNRTKAERELDKKKYKEFILKKKKQYRNALKEKEDNVVSSGLILFRKKGLYGYKNQNGKIIIKPKFLKAERFKNGRAKVTTKFGKKIKINTKGKKI